MPLWTPTALLVPVQSLQPQIDQVFLAARQALLALFPGSRVRHVGSTSLAPALTRGTIDIDLAVAAEGVAGAQAIVDASTEATSQPLPTRVRVHALGQPSLRLQIRQALAENPILLGEFVGMQKRHLHVVGRPYPQAKGAFFETLVTSAAFAEVHPDDILPYRIELATERLTLESALACDAAEIAAFRVANRAHLEASSGARPESFYSAMHLERNLASDAIERWCKRSLNLLVRRKRDRSLLGICNFSGFVWGAFRTCNIGYVVSKEAEGKGYMSEACAVALDYIYNEWGVHRVQAVYDADNTRSAALARRLGMRVEGTAKDYICLNGSWRDGVIASLLR